MKNILIVAAIAVGASANATQFFNSATFGNNAATRADFLTAAGVASGQHFEDFESYAVDTNMDGANLAGGASLANTGSGSLLIKSASSAFGGSNPIDTKALRHNESAYVEVSFSNAATYFGAYGIDHGTTTVIVTYDDATTENFSLEQTGASGNSAEFFGFVAEGGKNISKLQFDATGDGEWGLDNFEYGVVPEPTTMSLLALGVLAALKRKRRK